MTVKQLSFFDAPAAHEYERKQYEAKRDVSLVKILGVKGAQKWHEENARLKAKLGEILGKPRSPWVQAAIDEIQAKVLASTRPLADTYALLGIEPGSTKRDIKNAYRRKARKLHPDVGGDEASCKQLYAAYRQLLTITKE